MITVKMNIPQYLIACKIVLTNPNKEWTIQEDRVLYSLVVCLGDNRDVWNKISRVFTYRTYRKPKDCEKRWKNVIYPHIYKENMINSIDKILRLNTSENIKEINWENVSKYLNCRTKEECMKRWSNVIWPRLKLKNMMKFFSNDDYWNVDSGDCYNNLCDFY